MRNGILLQRALSFLSGPSVTNTSVDDLKVHCPFFETLSYLFTYWQEVLLSDVE